MLTLAAAVQAVESAGVCVAGVLAAIDATSGQSGQQSSGVALTVLAFIVVAMLAWIAFGLARVRAWSRTPAVLTQVCAGVVAIYLLQAHRFDWGIPALALAIVALAGMLTPASLRALNRTPDRPDRPDRPSTVRPSRS
jgi:hypothetical protein